MDIPAPGKLTGVNTRQRIHTSESRTIPMNVLLNVTWLSDSVCTHVTHDAFLLVSFCSSLRPGFQTVTRSKKHVLKNWLMMDKNGTPVRTIYRRVPVLQNLRSLCSPGARTSFSSRSNLGTTVITKIFETSSWRTRRTNLEAHGTLSTSALLGKIGSTIASQKTRAQLYSPEAA